MASGKALLGEVFGRFLFREARVSRVTEPSADFRRLLLEGPALRDVSWTPGDKVQVFLSEHGMRTYTPLRWNAVSGVTELLVFLHGSTPGAAWGRSVQIGDRVRLFGPRRSIDGQALPEALVLFGDETSLGVASALAGAEAGGPREASTIGPRADPRGTMGKLRCVFEVSQRRTCEPLLADLGLTNSVLVERREDDSHLDAVLEHLLSAQQATPAAEVVMTGRAAAIQSLRARMKRESRARLAKSKPYWAVGKVGLD
jgi:NADPH-dependent ferric siderophore reductase